MAIPYIREMWVDDVTEITDERLNNIEETLVALASDDPAPGQVPVWDEGQGRFSFSPGRGQLNGLAPLDDTGKILTANLPNVAVVGVPAGVCAPWFYAAAPSGWALADGSMLTDAETLYPDLWANADPGWKSDSDLWLPDLRGRVPVGQDVSAPEGLGYHIGEKAHQLSEVEMPSHNHGVTDPGHAHGIGAIGAYGSGSYASPYTPQGNTAWMSSTTPTGVSIQNAGGGAAHNNMQPSTTCNWIIYLG